MHVPGLYLALGGFEVSAFRFHPLSLHHKPHEYNSPPAPPSGWSGGTLDMPWYHRTPSNPRSRSAALIQLALSAVASAAFCLRRRCLAGDSPVIPRRIPEVDDEIPFICRAFSLLFASSALCAAFALRLDPQPCHSSPARGSPGHCPHDSAAPLCPSPHCRRTAPTARRPSVCAAGIRSRRASAARGWCTGCLQRSLKVASEGVCQRGH